jgi:hypothetical protein
MGIEVERASLMGKEEVKVLVTEVMEQYCNRGEARASASTTAMKPGNELTLSIFSELEYGLRMRAADGGPAVQRMPVEITTNGYLEFKKALPYWVTDMLVIRQGQLDEEVTLCHPPGSIKLDKAAAVLAVKLRDAAQTVRVVSFVTQVSRTYTPPASAE